MNYCENIKISFSDELTSLKYRHNINSPNVRYEYHINDDYEIFCFLAGCANYYIEGRVYSLRPGDVFILNNQETHRLIAESDSPIEIVVIHFGSRVFEYMGIKYHKLLKCFEERKIGCDNLVSEGVDNVCGLSSYIKEIDEHIEEDSKYTDLFIWSEFLKILIKINLLYEQKSIKTDDKRIKNNEKMLDVLNYINANLRDSLTLDAIAKEFYINKHHLCKVFKKSTGFSVNEYITYKRIMRAKELITQGIPVTEACFDSGFMCYSNFYKAFKKILKCAPSTLQK